MILILAKSDFNMKTPMVSIVMPLYNKENDVSRAVQSALNQTLADSELIVVNDGSTDRGPEIVRNISDSRIRLINQENAGVSAARNRGIQEAKSDLIAFLDADDEWKPDFLETILSLQAAFPSCDVFATNYLYREVSGIYRAPIIRGIPASPWRGIISDYFHTASRSDPPLWSSAIAVTKDAIESVGLFPVGVTDGEDLLTWARLALRYDIAYSTEPKAVFWFGPPQFGPVRRAPDEKDVVGDVLKALLPNVPPDQVVAFKRYIALWHRMRASNFLNLGARSEALQEIRNISRFSKRNPQLYIYFAIAISPKPIFGFLVKGFNIAKSLRRKLTSNRK